MRGEGATPFVMINEKTANTSGSTPQFRSGRFFQLPPQADTGTGSAERPYFLSDHIKPPGAEDWLRAGRGVTAKASRALLENTLNAGSEPCSDASKGIRNHTVWGQNARSIALARTHRHLCSIHFVSWQHGILPNPTPTFPLSPSRSFTAIRKDAGLCCGSRLRKGEVFAYVGRNQNLKDLEDHTGVPRS